MKSLLFITIFLLCAFQVLSSMESSHFRTEPIADVQKNPLLKDLLEYGKTQFIRKSNIVNGFAFAPDAPTSLKAVHPSS